MDLTSKVNSIFLILAADGQFCNLLKYVLVNWYGQTFSLYLNKFGIWVASKKYLSDKILSLIFNYFKATDYIFFYL